MLKKRAADDVVVKFRRDGQEISARLNWINTKDLQDLSSLSRYLMPDPMELDKRAAILMRDMPYVYGQSSTFKTYWSEGLKEPQAPTWQCFRRGPTDIQPDILILDEVLSVGDESFKNKCQRRIDKFWDSHVTILVVSHSMDFIKQSCDQAIWLNKGSIKMAGKSEEVVQSYLDSVT